MYSPCKISLAIVSSLFIASTSFANPIDPVSSAEKKHIKNVSEAQKISVEKHAEKKLLEAEISVLEARLATQKNKNAILKQQLEELTLKEQIRRTRSAIARSALNQFDPHPESLNTKVEANSGPVVREISRQGVERPILVEIWGVNKKLFAEISLGGVLRKVTIGDKIPGNWRVHAISVNSVEFRKGGESMLIGFEKPFQRKSSNPLTGFLPGLQTGLKK